MAERKDREGWWGDYELEVDRAESWAIGSLKLWIHRAASEWRLAYRWLDEEEPETWEHQTAVDVPEEGVEGERFAVDRTGGTVRLRAVTADRSVIARPRTPLRVPPGQQARIYVSSPLWVEVAVGEAPTVLRDLAAKRQSSTWFGSPPREGELAYALKTGARTRLEELPTRPYRFVTPVVIENQAADTLFVDRLNLPVPNLSVFAVGEALWSEEIRLLRSEEGDLAELDLRSGPPREAPGAGLLSEARHASEKGHLFQAFSSFLRL